MASELITILQSALPDALLPLMGVDATWTRQNAPAVTVRGIFDQSEDGRAAEKGAAGRLWIPQASLPDGAKKLDGITIDGTAYELRSDPNAREHFDGACGVWLYLRVK